VHVFVSHVVILSGLDQCKNPPGTLLNVSWKSPGNLLGWICRHGWRLWLCVCDAVISRPALSWRGTITTRSAAFQTRCSIVTVGRRSVVADCCSHRGFYSVLHLSPQQHLLQLYINSSIDLSNNNNINNNNNNNNNFTVTLGTDVPVNFSSPSGSYVPRVKIIIII